MPQDKTSGSPGDAVEQTVPAEASENPNFTPPCFLAARDAGKCEDVPVFAMRNVTPRDRRFQMQLLRELGATFSDRDELRKEFIERGLLAVWDEATAAAQRPKIEEYWDALDEFELQQKDDPTLKFEYDPVFVEAFEQLQIDVTEQHRPYGKLIARNARTSELTTATVQAIVVRRYSGLDTEPVIERGYLDIDHVDAMLAALERAAAKAGIAKGLASIELLVAVTDRYVLREAEAKNSASPSQSTTPPPSSTTGEEATAGTSTESATSTKTPEA